MAPYRQHSTRSDGDNSGIQRAEGSESIVAGTSGDNGDAMENKLLHEKERNEAGENNDNTMITEQALCLWPSVC